jgi:hypothetical protein
MTIKYKLGFTIDSEVLFGLLSKVLPIQDLSVEEVMERTPQLNDGPRFDERFDLPKRAPQVRRKRGNDYELNPYAGGNAVVLSVLGDGEVHPANEFHAPMKAAGYKASGMFTRVKRLKRHGLIVSPAKARYQLTLKGKKVWDERPYPNTT